MRKKIIFVIVCLLLLSGCSQVIDNNDYVLRVYSCLNSNNMTNNVALGYKYYLPKGVKKLKDYDYNQVFLADGEYLYLYVDIISYYYKKGIPSISYDDFYYYETFSYNNKNGYILILDNDSDDEDKYYLSILYNYSKIEGYVSHDKLNKIITLSSIILNSIDYNQNVIEKILAGDLGQFSEFTYEVDKPEGASSSFSQYLEEYVQKEEEEEPTEQLPSE